METTMKDKTLPLSATFTIQPTLNLHSAVNLNFQIMSEEINKQPSGNARTIIGIYY